MLQPEGQENPAAESPAPSAAQPGPIATQVLAADDDFNDNDSAIEDVGNLTPMTIDGKLYTSNIDTKKVLRVLDVGTGTGIWAMDYADEHPETEVLSIHSQDCVPVYLSFTSMGPDNLHNVPPNVKFEIDDMEKPWTYTTKFDFIFSRMMTGSFSDWGAYLKQCFENWLIKSDSNTNPGGYLEIKDIPSSLRCDDDTLKGTNLEKWALLMLEASRRLGVPLDSTATIKQVMEGAGYVDVTEVIYKWPMNRWPADKMKEIGLWSHEATTSNLNGMSIALFTRGLNWSVEETEVFLVDVRKDMKNSRIHSYWPIYIVTGRKPE